jgi:NAD(P)-dependent dehydrogenase (short-subunit alcohol dehydrogenase family)
MTPSTKETPVTTDFSAKTTLITGAGRGTGRARSRAHRHPHQQRTVHAYRPGGVDTAMQAWIREQDPERVGTALHVRFDRSFADGALITPERSAAALIGYLSADDTGAIWDAGAAPARS